MWMHEIVAHREGQLLILNQPSLRAALWRAAEMIWGGNTRPDRIVLRGRTVAARQEIVEFADANRWRIWPGRHVTGA